MIVNHFFIYDLRPDSETYKYYKVFFNYVAGLRLKFPFMYAG
jgi:hypothetical protein